jgi:hypothetical protein
MEDTMDDGQVNPAGRRWRRFGWTAGVLAVGALAGGLIALGLPASANTATSRYVAATGAPTDQGTPPAADGSRPGRAGETLLTGTDADKAKAAALKAVPGATIDRVETDADGAVYEAHVTKSDGTKATVKFDKDFNVTGVEPGMGNVKGGPTGTTK